MLKPVASGGINKVVCTCIIIIPTGEPDLLQVNKSFSKSFSLSANKKWSFTFDYVITFDLSK